MRLHPIPGRSLKHIPRPRKPKREPTHPTDRKKTKPPTRKNRLDNSDNSDNAQNQTINPLTTLDKAQTNSDKNFQNPIYLDKIAVFRPYLDKNI